MKGIQFYEIKSIQFYNSPWILEREDIYVCTIIYEFPYYYLWIKVQSNGFRKQKLVFMYYYVVSQQVYLVN